ncbi:hypothetical protein F2Q70_00045070 [Brassica cretica]|uniref:Uncharacterized protein n=1 Tax=Brassica cretica TaxID=69181 RepID=A0A8S9KFV5_BRACR|nr:hypothetical protein F2Q70_00045070 [Brassica cretica]
MSNWKRIMTTLILQLLRHYPFGYLKTQLAKSMLHGSALSDCVPTAERLTYRHLSTNKAVLDVVIQWSRLTIFLWNAPALNDKLFNKKVISPINTLQLASLEAESWRKANRKHEEVEEDHDDPHTSVAETLPLWIPQNPTCQIDASWIGNDSVSGLGWSPKNHMSIKFFGLRACRGNLSAFHTEMEGLF